MAATTFGDRWGALGIVRGVGLLAVTSKVGCEADACQAGSLREAPEMFVLLWCEHPPRERLVDVGFEFLE